MKQLLLALLLGVSSICYSQDTLRIPQTELEEFFLALDTLRTQDSIKTILIEELEKQKWVSGRTYSQQFDYCLTIIRERQLGIVPDYVGFCAFWTMRILHFFVRLQQKTVLHRKQHKI